MLHQEIEEAHELLFGVKVDPDRSALAPTGDLDLGLKALGQALRGGGRVCLGLRSGAPPRSGLRDIRLHESLDLTGGEPVTNGALRQLELAACRFEPDERACLSGGELSRAEEIENLRRKPKEADHVTDGRAAPSDAQCNLLLRLTEALVEGPEGLRLLDGIQVRSLEVLDEGKLQELLVAGNLSDDDGDLGQAGALSSPPAPFAGHDRVRSPAIGPDDEGLDHPLGSDRGRELVKPLVEKLASGLESVRPQAGDLDALDALLGAQEGVQAPTEAALLVVTQAIRPRCSRARAR